MIYIASPYSDPDPKVRARRFDAAVRHAGAVMRGGAVAFSPIVHGHPISERVGLPRTWEFWEKQCVEMLRYADSLHVLKIPGWDKSKGVRAEITLAKALNIPIYAVDFLNY